MYLLCYIYIHMYVYVSIYLIYYKCESIDPLSMSAHTHIYILHIYITSHFILSGVVRRNKPLPICLLCLIIVC